MGNINIFPLYTMCQGKDYNYNLSFPLCYLTNDTEPV